MKRHQPPQDKRFLPDYAKVSYCDARDAPLSTEHAVPYGINGPWTLLRASCQKCADITHQFERDSLRGLFNAVRIVFKMQTRHPKERSSTLPLVLEYRGAQRIVQVSPTDLPLYFPIIRLPQPGSVTNARAFADSVKIEFIHLAGPSFESVAQRYDDVDFVGTRLSFVPEDFARTLAKIAFCAGVFTLGLEPLRQSPIRKIILGEERDVWRWVGSWTGDPINKTEGLHTMQILAAGSDIHVILRLFAQFEAPEYQILLGSANPEFVNSDAWPWK